jgi:FtsP/CotA-like multicopper oxidase with cupredoxin domain
MQRREALKLLSLPALAPAGPLISPAVTPQAAQRSERADVEVALTAGPDEMSILGGRATRVWRYTGTVVRGPSSTLQHTPGSYLGPTIRLRRGQRVRIRLANRLAERTIVHWHGLDLPESSDGHPRLAIDPGGEYVYDFVVTNRAGTYWYHPHPHMRTAVQVHMGMAGLLIVEDDEERALALPAAQAEVLCVLQDRTVDTNSQIVYPDVAISEGARGMGRGRGGGMAMMALENGVLGERVWANGRPDYVSDVEAGWIRLRILNGSNARIYNLAFDDGRPMIIIGGDGGLLERPVERGALTIAPGQRADLLVDLSRSAQGSELHLRSRAFPPAETGGVGMMGAAGAVPSGAPLRVLTLRVRGRNTRVFVIPERLSSFPTDWTPVPDAPVRRVPLTFMRMQWQIDGRVFDLSDVAPAETVRAGSTQVWEFVNIPNPMGMAMAHPMHLHGRQFRVLSRTGAAPGTLGRGLVDDGWTDTVLVRPGETVRVQIPFSNHRGLFLYHCHILEHEDLGMMRNFRIV